MSISSNIYNLNEYANKLIKLERIQKNFKNEYGGNINFFNKYSYQLIKIELNTKKL